MCGFQERAEAEKMLKVKAAEVKYHVGHLCRLAHVCSGGDGGGNGL